MKHILICLSILLLFGVASFAQTAPDTLWTRTYGGSSYDGASSIQQTTDGGYVIAGGTESFGAGSRDIYVVKTDELGNTQWTHTYGGSSEDQAFSVIQTTDGGYIVAGNTWSFGAGGWDFYVVKTNSSGDTLWTKTYGGSGYDMAYSIQQTTDGGYVVAGMKQYSGGGETDIYVVKINNQGGTQWGRTYGGNQSDWGKSIQQTIDGGYVIAGYTNLYVENGHPYDIAFYVVKTDSLGNTIWTRTYGGSGSEMATSIQQTTDGGYIVAGFTDSFGAGSNDFYLVKINSFGDTLWSRTYGGTSFDEATFIRQTTDGGYIVAGVTYSFGAGGSDYYVVKTDAQGNMQWTNTYGGSSYDVAGSIQMTTDGGYVIAGHTYSFGAGDVDFYVVKTGRERQTCPTTPLPFVDNFDSPDLDSCWSWVREDTNHWSLTERPGWMRMESVPGDIDWWETTARNLLIRSVPDTNFTMSTKLEYSPEGAQGAGLNVYLDEFNFINLRRNSSVGVRTHSWTPAGNENADLAVTWQPIYLRIDKKGNRYATYASPDSLNWTLIKIWQRELASQGSVKVGISSYRYIASASLPADFDYLRVDPLPGTNVCGDVAGVWDSTGSPYYVTCDVTVPAGQTLEIRPSVQVLFTGHYKFYVYGNLQAIGTEQDSIIFTRAFPTEESRGQDIQAAGVLDTLRFAYCRFSEAHNYAPSEPAGGAIWADGCNVRISHSTFSNNAADHHGGALNINYGSLNVDNCVFAENHATVYCGGAIYLWSSSAAISGTVFIGNTAVWLGGAICGDGGSHFSLTHCMIGNCSASDGGGAVAGFHGSTFDLNRCTVVQNSAGNYGGACTSEGATINNCIFGSNSAPTSPELGGSGYQVAFSEIQGGYSGIGNINADPLFVDIAHRNFNLQWNSPCVDSGDPASPLDPDSTRADMGAFPYLGPRLRLISPVGGEQWRVFSNDTVRWVGTGVTVPIKIELNRHFPLAMWEVLSNSTLNDGIEAFFIVDPLSDSCRARISAVGDVYRDSSDANFSIVSSQGYLALVLQSQPTTPVLSWNAGTHECPETLELTYKLKNFGSENVVVFAPALISSAQFHVAHNCPSFFALSPGQMSTYNVTLTYNPQAEGSHRDTLRMQTDAVNATGGYVHIPLTGSQTRMPASPQIVITTQGQDARLTWRRITASTGGCPIVVTEYLVFYADNTAGPYLYHGHTTDSSYVHGGVVRHAPAMYYHVYASTTPSALFSELPPSEQNPPMSEEQVLGILYDRSVEYERVGH